MMFRKPLLSTPLGSLAQRKLAAWVLLKAMCLPYVGTPPNPVVPSHYGEFRQRKLPWRHVIHIARHDGSQLPMFVTWAIDVRHRGLNGISHKTEGYGITFSMDTFVGQILGFEVTRYAVAVKSPIESFSPYVLQVWPWVGTQVWPPSGTMDQQMLFGFSDAFKSLEV